MATIKVGALAPRCTRCNGDDFTWSGGDIASYTEITCTKCGHKSTIAESAPELTRDIMSIAKAMMDSGVVESFEDQPKPKK